MAGSPSSKGDLFQVEACLREAQRWRQEAANLREHASLPRLAVAVSAELLRNAEWADRTALHWEAGADDYRT